MHAINVSILMTKYAYIDESGTMPEDLIMTVALVVIDSQRMATKIHSEIIKALHPDSRMKGKKRLQEWYEQQEVHFADMTAPKRLLAGEILGQSNLKVYIASAAHSHKSQKHSYRFEVYTNLVKATINAAFMDFDQLTINIGRQGGSAKYGPSLIRELKLIPMQFREYKLFKKAKIFLAPAKNHGIQLADFYASASRNYLLSKKLLVSASPYTKIAHQVMQFLESNE